MRWSPSVLGRAFDRFARITTEWAGSTWGFMIAVTVVLVWGVTGPYFHYSDTWQLVINTGTTIVTFLMVFLIQRSQNRDSAAVQLKLNELIAAVKGASNRLIGVEDLSEEDIRRLRESFAQLAEVARTEVRHGKPHTVEEVASQVAQKVAGEEAVKVAGREAAKAVGALQDCPTPNP